MVDTWGLLPGDAAAAAAPPSLSAAAGSTSPRRTDRGSAGYGMSSIRPLLLRAPAVAPLVVVLRSRCTISSAQTSCSPPLAGRRRCAAFLCRSHQARTPRR